MKVRPIKVHLNENQQKIVNWNKGPLLVSAGPGSGKSRVIVERIARLCNEGVSIKNIFATTFTKKAAEVMNERLKAKGIDLRLASIQTMHSFCWHLIIRHNKFRGWKFDEKDQAKIVLKNILGYKGIRWGNADITKVETFISHCRNALIEPVNSIQLCQGEYFDRRYSEVYFRYVEEMALRKLITFDDMLYYGVRLLQENSNLLQRVRNQFHYTMVDEFQDSNQAQLTLTDLVSAPEYNLMVVGDIDQAIYSWRGAIPQFMLKFAEKYQAEIIQLGINYRCAPKIVESAASCIVNNEQRFTKELQPARKNEVEIKYIDAVDTSDEAQKIAHEIKILNQDGVTFGNMIVLMRTNAQSRAIEEAFIDEEIPFIVLGNVSFYDRKEIKGLLDYLRLIEDNANIIAGESALNKPFRFIGKKTLDGIRHKARSGESYLHLIEKYIANNYTSQSETLMGFVNLIKSLDPDDNPANTLSQIIRETKYIESLLREEGSDTAENSRAANVGEMIQSAGRFRNTSAFLKFVRIQTRLRKKEGRKKEPNRVQVMTIHKSKGIEADTVFLIGANQGIIPHGMGEIEEERRLFYVAITRAKNNLFISAIQQLHNGNTQCQLSISPFIYEAKILQRKSNFS